MYNIKHRIGNNNSWKFIMVDDAHKVFAVGDTGACACSPLGYEITSHATAKELKDLRNLLTWLGYAEFDAGSIEDMDKFRTIVREE